MNTGLVRTPTLSTLLLCAVPFLASRLDAQRRWAVDSTPILDIRGVNDKGDVMFGSANWATRLSNGIIAVADAATPAVQFFDGKGIRFASAGRSGQGPGDFRTISWIGQCAKDLVFAWDFVQTRVQAFDAKGALTSSIPLGSRGGAQTVTSCNGNGLFVQVGTPRRAPPPSPPDPKLGYFFMTFLAAVQVVGDSGAVRFATPEFPVSEMVGGNMNGRGGGGMPRPLGAATYFALGRDRLYVGNSDSARVDVFALADGRRERSISVAGPRRPVTSSHFEHAADAGVALVPSAIRETARKWVLGTPMPDHLPAFTGLFVDPMGLLWVVTTSPGDVDTWFKVYDAAAKLVADVLIAVPNFTVFEVGADYILGASDDSAGEPHVTVYRVRRGS